VKQIGINKKKKLVYKATHVETTLNSTIKKTDDPAWFQQHNTCHVWL
jgi:hypothetical protein